MSCQICNEEFTTESCVVQMECCMDSCHTKCMFEELILFNYSMLECPLCHSIIKRYNTYNENTVPETEEANLETAEFRNDLKKVKKIIVEKKN